MSLAAFLCSPSDQNWVFVNLTGAAHTAASQEFISFNAAGAQTVTLPTAPADNAVVAVRRDHLGAGAKNVTAGGSDTIRVPSNSGAATVTTLDIADPSCNAGTVHLVYNAAATSWWVLSVQ